ncbi:MAG: FkbM family methyltransferase [Rhodospirillaceae bacterium]|nr:FkbM family methyltransferase [Rhodospirillaceae bacterium]
MTALAEIHEHTFYLPALGPGSVVLDLGAASGGFAAEVSRLKGCTCHCAEASPGMLDSMIETEGVHHHHAAIGGAVGPMRMAVGGREFGRFWVRTTNGEDAGEGNDEIEVPGETLGSFMARCDVERADLVKVDIEGAEFDMFDAASDDTLSAIGQFSVEFHDFLDPALTPKVKAVIARLENLGFETIVMTRHAHGDVVFLNRAMLQIEAWQLFYMRTAIKYGRGVRRLLSRRLGRAA